MLAFIFKLILQALSNFTSVNIQITWDLKYLKKLWVSRLTGLEVNVIGTCRWSYVRTIDSQKKVPIVNNNTVRLRIKIIECFFFDNLLDIFKFRAHFSFSRYLDPVKLSPAARGSPRISQHCVCYRTVLSRVTARAVKLSVACIKKVSVFITLGWKIVWS